MGTPHEAISWLTRIHREVKQFEAEQRAEAERRGGQRG